MSAKAPSLRPAGTSPVLADLVSRARVHDVVLVLAGTALIAISGYAVIPLPFTPVPLTLATLTVLVLGAALGPLRGASSAGLYLLLGVAGMPLFGAGKAGWEFSSFGYIVGWVAAAAVTGLLARRRADRSPGSTIALAAAGSLTIYAFGVPWLAAFLGLDLRTALAYGVLPFLIGDALKIVVAAGLLPTAWRLLDRRSNR